MHLVDPSFAGLIVVSPLGALIVWVLVGLLAGWLAGLVTRGRGYGCCGDVLLGWVGSILGGFIVIQLLGMHLRGFLGSIAVAFVGALILLLAVRLLSRS
ncbi:MAG TPA: GlsB/YeaQ/YmgE family stress response membrane protein [Chloroflexota bacterium]|nr:GlsB/YeaQ/YmgE family stress response membrane protein [Chloroflexota bacterium]